MQNIRTTPQGTRDVKNMHKEEQQRHKPELDLRSTFTQNIYK